MKAAYHQHEFFNSRKRARLKAKHLRILQYLPHADIILIGGEYGPVYGCLAYAAYRIVDDALQGLLILWINNDAQVCYIVFDLFTLVKRNTAINCIRNIHSPQAFFKGAALGIGAVQDRDILIVMMVAQLLLLYRICYEFALIIVCHCSHQLDLFTSSILCKKRFGYLAFIVLDDLIGNTQDVLRTAIVLLQFDHLHFIIVFLELQYVLYGGTTERVNALGIITNHANIFMHCTQQLNDLVLRGVGILVLIDQDVLEFVL